MKRHLRDDPARSRPGGSGEQAVEYMERTDTSAPRRRRGIGHGVLGARRVRTLVAALAATSLFAAACSSGDGVDEGTSEDGDAPAAELGGEAPTLAERVEAGDLPAAEERLPVEPLVVEPVESIGAYGGTWETALNGPGDDEWIVRTIGYEGLLRWVPDWTGAPGDDEIIPNIAESYEVSGDGTEYTFTLREGMKWSDGEPVTVDDAVFAYEEITLNTDLFPATPAQYVSGGEPATLRVEDDHTFTFVFAEPNGMFLQQFAEGVAGVVPAHYLRQFHADHNDDIDALVSEEGFGNWVELFEYKREIHSNADLPVLNPWVVTQALGDGSSVVAERNPYYWKTDPEGNQLPYLDRVRYQILDDEQVMLASALQGDFDLHARTFNTPVNKPVLAEGREDGDFDFFSLGSTLASELVIMLNLTHQDEALRDVFSGKDFRIGLSHAIDRQEIIDTVFQRQGDSSQVAPRPASPFYNEQLATQYTEYDVDLANQFLDDAGYDERDSDGYRLGPDGERISFLVSHASVPSETADALDLISDYWAEVGIEMRPDPMDRSLFEERRRANELDAAVWKAGGGLDVVQNPYWYLPVSDRSDYAQLWAEWHQTGGESGDEPPEPTQRQLDLYGQLHEEPDAGEQQRLMEEILQIAADEFYHIGVLQPIDGYGIVKSEFRNVPESMPESFRVRTPALTNPEQYFKSS
ncbi:ABC transporter substrate-binding protein [Phytoactinopolyspora endophytica]|uniref:ABC transporter substrate-binding protein n=1 Tax=Phytoactinopolyspora endophytica TaxID=1642495 RepID=UPI00101B855B|nr:ABC transporter substrate-binding protein [Phytoactinopolyspora endophytica]